MRLFSDIGIPIGDPQEIVAEGNVEFPLRLTLAYSPDELTFKGVDRQDLRVFFFDAARGIWSQNGITTLPIETDGIVPFETTHLSVFRLGVTRGSPPVILQLDISAAAPSRIITMLGSGFSPIASRNVLVLGGAYVMVSVDENGSLQPLDLNDDGDTVRLLSVSDEELDRAELGSAPANNSSWTREVEGDAASAFIEHTSHADVDRLFSPGTTATGATFEAVAGGIVRPPISGDMVINEVLLAPPDSFLGDANGDGEATPLGDEFVELVNVSTDPLDLGGCRIETSQGARHQFPEGTTLPSGMAMVVFGVQDPLFPPHPAGPFGGVVFQPTDAIETLMSASVATGSPFGPAFLTVGRLRQISNPFPIQILTPLADDRQAGFDEATDRLPALAGRSPRLVRIADLDRDLDMDIVAVDVSDELVILLNTGLGTFLEASSRVTLPEGRNRTFDIALADLTEDGAPEIIIGDTDPAGSYTQIIVMQNSGGGYFTLLSSAGVLNSVEAVAPRALSVGNLDDDADLDVIVAMAGDGPIIFRNDGSGQLSHDPTSDVLIQDKPVSPSALQLADVDMDGNVDIILAAENAGLGAFPALQLFRNLGSGEFDDVTTNRLPLVDKGIDALSLGDVDGDKDIDIIIGADGQPVRLYINDGSGNFTEETTGRIEASGARALALADVDGDRDLDVIVGSPPRDQVFLNTGSGVFESSNALPNVPGAHREVVAADVDQDGDLDLIGAGSDLSLLINTGAKINHRPEIGPIDSPKSVMETEPIVFEVTAKDVDGDAITLSAELKSGEKLTTIGAAFNDHGDGTAAFSWTPEQGQGERGGKTYQIVVIAQDEDLAEDRKDVVILVEKFNRPPSLNSISDITIDELDEIEIHLKASDPDPDDELTFSFSVDGLSALPGSVKFNGDTGVFKWIPDVTAGNGPGGSIKYELVFSVSDLSGAKDDEQVSITVRDKDHPPQFTKPEETELSVFEGEELSFDVSAYDPDGKPVTIVALKLPDGAEFDEGAGVFAWTPTFLQGRAQPYLARFEADDGKKTSRLDVDITVNQVNQPPSFVDLTDKTVQEGELLSFKVRVEDLDGDPLTVEAVEPLPDGATFNSSSLRFKWTPDFTQAGKHNVTFKVNDTHITVSKTIEIEVGNVNHPPVLTPVDDQEALEGRLLQFAIEVSDEDVDDSITVEVVPLPSGASVFQQGPLWLFQWVPGMDQSGVYPLVIEVTDGHVAEPVSDDVRVTVLDNPGFQPLVGTIGFLAQDPNPENTAIGTFGDAIPVTLEPGSSIGIDLGEVHPALVSTIELFNDAPEIGLTEADLSLFVSEDDAIYQAYTGAVVVDRSQNHLSLQNLNISERYIKIHRLPASDPGIVTATNFLPQIARASGAIILDGPKGDFLEHLAEKTFLYFSENLTDNGLIPDRVTVINGTPSSAPAYSTAAAGFWLASLPIAVEHGWVSREEAEGHALRTLEFYLGDEGGPVEGRFGMFYHFINADGTRFTQFGDDGVSILDSTLLFLGALASGEYFGGNIATLAQRLYDQADWDAFYDHSVNQLRLFWKPEGGFIRHLDYTSEGILSYLLAAGSTTHPIAGDDGLLSGADAYYAFSRGNFGRVLGRFGRDGKPLLQSFYGSLFTYLYPTLWVDMDGARDAFNINWAENTREAILANYRFAQAHPEFGYGRLNWGISASDGPSGYQGLYGAPPHDVGAKEPPAPVHDGTVAPYALAGSLPFAADLALPALQYLSELQHDGTDVFDMYGLRDGVNINQDFIADDYLGIDEGALLLGLDGYQDRLISELMRNSEVMQKAFEEIGLAPASTYALRREGAQSAHAYLLIETTDHLTQTVELEEPAPGGKPGDYLLELHPYGMDTSQGERFVDVDVKVNGQFLKTVRFQDRRSPGSAGFGTVDVGSVYVPIPQLLVAEGTNTIELTWVAGERWIQLEDVELNRPTGRQGTQETWQIGEKDGSFGVFGNERLTNDSYLVGDDAGGFERALNVVDEPRSDILFELSDVGINRLLRLVATETKDELPVTVEIGLNNAIVGDITLSSGEEGAVSIPRNLLRLGWNHLVVRHANVPDDGEYIIWDFIGFEPDTTSDALQVTIRNIDDNQLSPELQFGTLPPQGAVALANQYLEVGYDANGFERITISTDNRSAPIHRYTGDPDSSAAGLVGEIDSTLTVPLLWQVYDAPQPSLPSSSDIEDGGDVTEWAFVPDLSEPDVDTEGGIAYRSLVGPLGLGDRPIPGRSASNPITVYLAGDFKGKPAQTYATDRLLIERISQ